MLKSKPLTFQLSANSKRDLEAIYKYTMQNFGIDQANFYVTSFDKTFENLTINPHRGRKQDEIKRGLLSILHKQHVIFYRIKREQIWVVRILHGSRDFVRHL
jgi:toxin ParE1/3/4